MPGNTPRSSASRGSDPASVRPDSGLAQSVKGNAYRVLAGRTNHIHRVTLAVASADRLAVMLDFVVTDPAMAEWLAGAAKYPTVVANGTSSEITK